MENIRFAGADIGYRNFAGKERDYNPEGNRNFCVFMDVNRGRELEREGWNIKYTKPTENTVEQKAFLPVSVSFERIPPNVFLISSKTAKRLDEETIGMLDWSELKTVDLEIRPYEWSVSGKKGVKAYLKSLYAVLEEDPFAEKYFAQIHDKKDDEDDLPF